MAQKRPAETSTEEPDSKKQAVTPEMYEEQKAKNAKLEKRIAELEKRNTDAQEMTQNMVDNLTDRTAKAEEDLAHCQDRQKQIIYLSNPHNNDESKTLCREKLNWLLRDEKNKLETYIETHTFTTLTLYQPGKSVSSGVMISELSGQHHTHHTNLDFPNKCSNTKGQLAERVNDKCSICKKNPKQYSHFEDRNSLFPYKMRFGTYRNEGCPTMIFPTSTEEPKTLKWGNPKNSNQRPTLCGKCIRSYNIQNTSMD